MNEIVNKFFLAEESSVTNQVMSQSIYIIKIPNAEKD